MLPKDENMSITGRPHIYSLSKYLSYLIPTYIARKIPRLNRIVDTIDLEK